MRRLSQVAAILSCAGLACLVPGCGGDDDPGDPGTPSCSIDITFPDVGASYLTGQDVNLRWDDAGGGEVRIALLKAGVEQGEIVAATRNDGFYRWAATTMGATSGADFGLAVTHTGDGACADTLVLTLLNTVGCAITVDTPDTLEAGDDHLITWDSENTSGLVDVEFWYFTGVQNDSITQLAVATPDDGEFLWENVDSFHIGTSSNFFIRVADASVVGCHGRSDRFRIEDPDVCVIDVIWPNSTSVFDPGDSMLIQFDVTGSTGSVDLLLYEGYVNRVDWIRTVPIQDGQYTWPAIAVPAEFSGVETAFRVKVVNSSDQFCLGFSQKFTIHLDP